MIFHPATSSLNFVKTAFFYILVIFVLLYLFEVYITEFAYNRVFEGFFYVILYDIQNTVYKTLRKLNEI